MFENLDRTARLRLLRVVTAVAWLDGEVHDNERAFVERLIERLRLPAEERAIALGYLEKAPHPAEADPLKIPPDHRRALVELAREMAAADGHTHDEEQECLEHLEMLLLS